MTGNMTSPYRNHIRGETGSFRPPGAGPKQKITLSSVDAKKTHKKNTAKYLPVPVLEYTLTTIAIASMAY